MPTTSVFCCSSQENPIDLYSLHRKSCSQAESGAKTVDEADKKGQNSLYICLQTIHGDSRTDGEEPGPPASSIVQSSRLDPLMIPGVFQDPQYGCKEKSLAFSSGNISMDIFTDRMGYKQGTNISWCFRLAALPHCCALSIPHKDSCAVVLRPSGQHTVQVWSTVNAGATGLCGGTGGKESQASSIPPSCCQTGSFISEGSLPLLRKPACWCVMVDIMTCHSFQQTLRGPLFVDTPSSQMDLLPLHLCHKEHSPG